MTVQNNQATGQATNQSVLSTQKLSVLEAFTSGPLGNVLEYAGNATLYPLSSTSSTMSTNLNDLTHVQLDQIGGQRHSKTLTALLATADPQMMSARLNNAPTPPHILSSLFRG